MVRIRRLLNNDELIKSLEVIKINKKTPKLMGVFNKEIVK
jgi:hypothetical protein